MRYKKFVVVIIILSFFSFLTPEKAQAQYVDVVQLPKEFALDTIAVIIAKIILKKLTAQTVNWINSGFKGNPGYVSNPSQFFLDIGDSTASVFLSATELNKLCSPFKAQVRLALVKNYIEEDYNFSCTLSTLKNNYDAFTNDFSVGGWDGWFEMTQTSGGNPYSVYLSAQNKLLKDIGEKKEKQEKELSQNSGFLSYKVCPKSKQMTAAQAAQANEDYSWDGYQAGDCLLSTDEETATPGSTINKSLSDALGTGWKQLEAADEINEIITALVTQLIERVVGGIGNGLRGASQPGTGGTPSFTSQLSNDPQPDPVDTGSLTLSPTTMECVTGANGDQSCSITPGTISGPSWVQPVTVQTTTPTPAQCIQANGNYAGALMSAMQDALNANPTLADSMNTEDNDFAFLAAVAALSPYNGYNITDQVLNGNDNPNRGDLLAIWRSGDTTMERYDVILSSGAGDRTVRSAVVTQFTGSIPLNCTSGGGGSRCRCATVTPPPPGGGGGTCGLGNDPGTPTPIANDLSNVTVDSSVDAQDIASWPVSNTLTLNSVSFSGPNICLNHTMPWPSTWIDDPNFGIDVPASGWVFIWRNGGWHAATFEYYYRNGGEAECREAGSVWDNVRFNSVFASKTGETYGFMISGLARAGHRNIRERSNVIMKTWSGPLCISRGGGGPPPPPPPPPTNTTPVITSISPTSVPVGGTLTINGTNLTSTVRFFTMSGVRQTDVGSVNSSGTQTTVTIPTSLSPGNYTVDVYKSATSISNIKFLTITSASIIPPGVLPTPDHSMCFGYYHLNAQYGDFSSEVNYTNIDIVLEESFIRRPNVASADIQKLNNAFDKARSLNHKVIYAPAINQGDLSSSIDMARQHWNNIDFIYLTDEPTWDKATAESNITIFKNLVSSKGLTQKPIAINFTPSQILTGTGYQASNLDIVGTEAYMDPTLQNNPQLISYLNTQLDQLKQKIGNKKIFFVIQAYNRNGEWQNLNSLQQMQTPAYLKSYNDPRVVGLLAFSYARLGGTRDNPSLKQLHQEIFTAIQKNP